MNGTIYFNDLKELATFLKSFEGSTALFEVKQCIDTKRWLLKFTGGY